MLQVRPMDLQVPIFNQLGEDLAPVIQINVFTVDAADVADVAALLKAREDDANWMKSQAGYICTQLHRGIAGSCVFLNYAVWESVAHFRAAFTHPEFQNALAAYPLSAVARRTCSAGWRYRSSARHDRLRSAIQNSPTH